MIHFKKSGNGPALLLIHGFCETLDMWDHWVSELNQSHTVYSIDLPGFGKSPLPSDTVTLETIAVELHEWMEHENITNPIIIEHSLGGYVTLALTELLGTEIRAIGLFHSTAFADTEEKRHVRNKTYDFIEKFGVPKFIESFVPPLFSEKNRDTMKNEIENLVKAGKESPKRSVLSYIHAMRDRKDRFEIWKVYSNPKLLIAGYYDLAVNIEQSRWHKPYANHYHELPEAGHMGMFEESKLCLQYTKDFLDSL